MAENGSKSGFLDQLVARIPQDFGRTHHLAAYCVFGPWIVAQLAYAAWSGKVTLLAGALLFAAGIAAWTLLEYLLHRFSFHSRSQHPLVRPFNSSLHLLHHAQPASKHYVAAPLILSIPVYAAMFGLFWLAAGGLEQALVVGSSFGLAFLFYEYVHFVSHQRNPRNRVLKFLKKHHMLHHFADKDVRFGVTSPAWDFVFGTYADPSSKARSPRAPGSPTSIAS